MHGGWFAGPPPEANNHESMKRDRHTKRVPPPRTHLHPYLFHLTENTQEVRRQDRGHACAQGDPRQPPFAVRRRRVITTTMPLFFGSPLRHFPPSGRVMQGVPVKFARAEGAY